MPGYKGLKDNAVRMRDVLKAQSKMPEEEALFLETGTIPTHSQKQKTLLFQNFLKK